MNGDRPVCVCVSRISLYHVRKLNRGCLRINDDTTTRNEATCHIQVTRAGILHRNSVTAHQMWRLTCRELPIALVRFAENCGRGASTRSALKANCNDNCMLPAREHRDKRPVGVWDAEIDDDCAYLSCEVNDENPSFP